MSTHDAQQDRGNSDSERLDSIGRVSPDRELPGDIFGPSDLHGPTPTLALSEAIDDLVERHGSSGAEFDRILEECRALRHRKVDQRGESRYQEKDSRRSKLLLYADLHRKFQRLERYLFYGSGGTQDLEDDFKDLANYAIMGVQLKRREDWR